MKEIGQKPIELGIFSASSERERLLRSFEVADARIVVEVDCAMPPGGPQHTFSALLDTGLFHACSLIHPARRK